MGRQRVKIKRNLAKIRNYSINKEEKFDKLSLNKSITVIIL